METINHLNLLLLALLFGITAKYADLVNEHGLKEIFKGSGILSGFTWGAAGIGIFYLSPHAGITYVAHVLYWFQRIKLEYANHALAGVMILLGGFSLQGEFIYHHRNDLLILYSAYTLTGYLQTYYKTYYKTTYWFWRLRLRIYLIPLLYSIYYRDPLPFTATIAGMLGCETMTYLFREYKEEIKSSHLS